MAFEIKGESNRGKQRLGGDVTASEQVTGGASG